MTRFILIALFIPLSIFGVLAQTNLQRSVFFDKDKSELKPQSVTSLLEVMDFLNKNPTFQILLKGFTDADGSDEHNRALSERRVQTVQQFLVQKGVNTAKVTTLALGKGQPIADNATDEGKKQNRRVDINVTFVQNTPSVSPPSTVSLTTKPNKIENLFNLYRELATPIQTFKINTSKDTILRGAKGTILSIPKNAFAGVTNGAIVDFKLKEDYSFSDIIRDNLTTMSGDQAMQTGGMIYTEANFNGQQLSLQQSLQVRFNSKVSQLEGMQLYTGERNMQKNGNINWKPINSQVEVNDSLTDPITIFARDDGPFIPYLVLYEKTRKPLTIKELCDTSGCSPLFLTTFQKDSFTVRPNMSNTCGAMAMYVLAHPLSRNKPISKIHRATFDDAYVLYGVNDFDVLRKQKGQAWDSLMAERMAIALFTESPAYIARKKREDSLRIVNIALGRIQDSINIENDKTYKELINKNPAFALQKLGWVNCDRLQYYRQNEIATIKINLLLKEHCDLKVISKKGKRILSSNQYIDGISEFRTLVNEDLVLVAMKVENGESFLSIMNMKGQNIELTPNFKALSAAEIKEKLKVLDN